MTEDSFTYTPPTELAIEFNPPLKAGDGKIDRFGAMEPTGNQVFAAEAKMVGKTGPRAARAYQLALLASATKVPEAYLSDLPMGIFNKVFGFVQAFVDAGNGDGKATDVGVEPQRASMTILFDPPLKVATTVGAADLPALVLTEPTLGQMAKAETALGDMSAHRARQFQMLLVGACSGESQIAISALPVSVLNRAASFCMGFSQAGQATSMN